MRGALTAAFLVLGIKLLTWEVAPLWVVLIGGVCIGAAVGTIYATIEEDA